MTEKDKRELPEGEVRQSPRADGEPPSVMVVVVPLEPSEYVMPEESYDFSLPLFGGRTS